MMIPQQGIWKSKKLENLSLKNIISHLSVMLSNFEIFASL